MRLTAIRGASTGARKGNRFTFVEISRDDHRVDVRFAADRRRVAELGRDEPHRQHDVALRFRLRLRRPELRQDRRRAQRAAPGAKILGAVAADSRLQIFVDLARGDHVPLAVRSIAKQRRAGRLELSLHETHERAIVNDLSLPDASLPGVLEARGAVAQLDVRFAQRRDPEGPVLLRVLLAADATERLADQAQDRRGHRVGIERRRACGRPGIALERAANARKLLGHLSHPMILAELAPLDCALVVPVLLSAARVVPPRLNGAARRGGDVHVTPRGRHSHRVDPVERATVADRALLRVHVPESRSLGPESPDPGRHVRLY